MKYEIFHSIDDIEKEEWSALSGDTIPDQQYEWFRVVEKTVPRYIARYVVVREGPEVKGIAGLNLESEFSLGILDRYPMIKNVLQSVFSSPVLEATAPHSSFSSIFLTQDRNAEEMLFAGISDITKKETCMGILLSNFYEKKPFTRYGYSEFMLSPNTCLDIQWDSFDTYLDSWSPKRRHSLKSSLRKGEKKGYHIVFPSSLGPYAEQMSQLKTNVANHNNNPSTILPPSFFRECESYCGDLAEAALCFKDDSLVAFTFSLHTQEVCTVKFVGLDYKYSDAYYYLYVDALRRGIEHGFKRMYFGRGTYTFKERLGCHRIGIINYIRMKNTFLNPIMSSVFRLWKVHEDERV
ncbi:MAG: GNAT family N-acetyltransferase [Theionarchaea archaeon]|nr:GNAT family N-acetyltransferase [Theionarchaea archaeon]